MKDLKVKEMIEIRFFISKRQLKLNTPETNKKMLSAIFKDITPQLNKILEKEREKLN